jgi:hypothetical protein
MRCLALAPCTWQLLVRDIDRLTGAWGLQLQLQRCMLHAGGCGV